MTLTQILVLSVGSLSLLISAELLRSMARQRGHTDAEASAHFRQVGTFGALGGSSTQVASLPSTGSSGNALLTLFALAMLIGTGVVVKFAWSEAHPDIRSAYGRAYERCVQEEKISRWNVAEVQRCVGRERSAWQ
jgi:LPXTG-motif cell wall-anchored protein